MAAEPDRLSLGLPDRVGRRAGEHRSRQKAGLDDAEREHPGRKRAGEWPQSLGGLRGGLDIGDAAPVQDGGRRDHDGERHKVRERHADERVDLDPVKGRLALLGGMRKVVSSREGVDVLRFLSGLSEEQTGARR